MKLRKESEQRRHGVLARAFVIANRVFGWVVVVGGASLLVQVVVALLHGRALNGLWIPCTIGLAALAVGVVYVRAPLSRAESPRHR